MVVVYDDGVVAMGVVAALAPPPPVALIVGPSRLHSQLLLLHAVTSSSLYLTSNCAISRGLPVHRHDVGRTGGSCGRVVLPRLFRSPVVNHPEDCNYLGVRRIGSSTEADGEADGDLEADNSTRKSQRGGQRDSSVNVSSQKKRQGCTKVDQGRDNSVTSGGKMTINKLRNKYKDSEIGEDTSYSSTRTQHSVTLQEMVGNSVHEQDKIIQNGQSRKQHGLNMKSAGVMEELKVKRRKDSVELDLQHTLEMCSKHANVTQALELYDKVVAEGSMSFDQYCFNVVLYLCSSAATGVLKQGKSGKERSQQGSGKELVGDHRAEDVIVLSNDQKEFCLKRGFQIYEAMKLQGVPPNEATFTAVARLAVAKGDGDLAFDMVKQMAEAKITPRLRSYSPALYTYCKHKIADKAFEVDEHMRAAGVRPEEAELEALLKLSVELGLEDKVYSLLHRLRATVREVSASTVGVVQQWFTSTAAVNAGKLNWSNLPQTNAVKEAVERGGGGWHGLGWLGKGPWEVNTSQLDEEGVCQTCGEQLVTIDLDPRETEMFAESLFKLACQREAKNNEFRKFQAWLDQHGPFDAIVDAANVALHNQNFGDGGFNFYQLNAVVNGIQKKIGSNREPLVLLHHQRTKGRAATASSAMSILKRWQNADCIYTTPTGSNDDWYWLYAAVRYKCVLVTNDEMRDHLFELLGNEFFPKWKERHQVRFTLNRKDPVFHMPRPYSIVIQESEKGSWHIPKSGGNDIAMPREWLCVTRSGQINLETLQIEQPSESLVTSPEVDNECRPVSKTCLPQKVEVAGIEEQPSSFKRACSPRKSHLPQSFRTLESEILPESAKIRLELEEGCKLEDREPSSLKKVSSPRRSHVSKPSESSSIRSELDEVCRPGDQRVEVTEPEEQLSPKEPHLPRESQIPKSSESSSIRHESEECMPVAMIFSAQKVEVAEPQEQSPSLKKVRSPRRSRLPYSSTILQKLKTAERMCTEKPIDFQI